MQKSEAESTNGSVNSMPVINEVTFKLTELFAYVGETSEKIAKEKSKADFLELQNQQVTEALKKYKRKVAALKAKNDMEALAKAE